MKTAVQEHSDVRANLEKMSQVVLAQVRALKSAFNQTEPTLLTTLEEIVKRDDEVDKLELSLDSMCLSFMNHQAPLGRSLRSVVGAIDVAAGLERIGDCTEYVARHMLENLEMRTVFPAAWKLLQEMTDKCCHILEQSVNSLAAQDASLAKLVPPLDNLVDALQDKAYSLAITEMRSGRVDVEMGMMLVLMANKLESIADITCHIAGTVVFIVKAKRLRHADNAADESE